MIGSGASGAETELKLLLIGLGRPRRQCQRLSMSTSKVAQKGSDENDGTERRKALERWGRDPCR